MRAPRWSRLLAALLATAVGTGIAAAALPDNPYQRFQYAGGTINAGLRRTYERINDDPTPIDVAIVGASRTMLGLSEDRIAHDLALAGKPAHVANLSVVGEGRNLEWVVADELYRHASPRVLILPITENPPKIGHPVFRLVAPAAAIAVPAAPLLYSAPGDLIYLPFRQLSLFVARAWPEALHLPATFDAAAYARAPHDLTVSHRAESGRWIEMDRPMTAAALRVEQRVEDKPVHSLPPRLMALLSDDEMVYVRQIIALTAAHRSRICFVFLPHFEGSVAIPHRDFYARHGTIVSVADLRDDSSKFQGWNHLNRAGAVIASDRVAAAIVGAL